MKKTLYRIIPFLSLSALLGPAAVYAQPPGFGGSQIAQGTDAVGVLDNIARVIDVAIPILVALIVVFLIFNGIKYAMATEEQKQTEARQGMINAGIALFVVLAIWGIIALLSNTLGIGLQGQQTIQSPVKLTP